MYEDVGKYLLVKLFSRPHTTDFPQKVAKEGKWDPLLQENPGWWNIIIWLDTFPETYISPENGGPLEKEIPIGNHHF